MNTEMDSFALALKPLAERKSAGQNIFELLKHAITCGDISSGSRVVESHIASIMGVSRTPVREAIHKLEREGLLTKLQHGGYTVTRIDPGGYRRLFWYSRSVGRVCGAVGYRRARAGGSEAPISEN